MTDPKVYLRRLMAQQWQDVNRAWEGALYCSKGDTEEELDIMRPNGKTHRQMLAEAKEALAEWKAAYSYLTGESK